MIDYSVSMASYESFLPETLSRVLACPSIERVMFPAKLPIAPKKTIELNHASEFSLSIIPEAFKDKAHITVPLESKTGVDFDINLYLEKAAIPSIISFVFNSRHIEKGIVTLKDLKSIFAEVTPVFKVLDGVVYDQYENRIYRPDGGFGFEKNKSYKKVRLHIDWVTFFGRKAVELLGSDRFANLHSCAEKYELEGGIMVVLQEEPVDNTNPEHLARKKQAERELGFDELMKK